MTSTIISFWSENKRFLTFIFLMLVFRSAVADWNDVPTGSMKPTILEGDRIIVDKLAYDVRVPFTQTSLLKLNDPTHNDIIIFESEKAKKRLVKRVIGVPSDEVAMINNQLYINGTKLQYESIESPTDNKAFYRETLKGKTHVISTSLIDSTYSNFGPVIVPEGHYLVLGDNRDNSADSRAIGFVPRNEIIGKSETVALSLNYENFFLPRKDRFLHTL